MPWSPKQQRAIAIKLREEGKTSQQIGDFFDRHSGPVKKQPKRKKSKSHAMVTRG